MIDENEEIESVTQEQASLDTLQNNFQMQAGGLEGQRAHHATKLQWTREISKPLYDILDEVRKKIFELSDPVARANISLDMIVQIEKYLVRLEAQIIADERYTQGLRDGVGSCFQAIDQARGDAPSMEETAPEPGKAVRPVGEHPEKLADFRRKP